MVELREEFGGEISDNITMDEILDIILKEETVTPVYQPLVSLKSGEIMGYEALSRFNFQRQSSFKLDIEKLFCEASRLGRLWELEKLCREAAIKNAYGKPKNALLFLNVDPNVIHDSHFKTGFTKEILDDVDLLPEEIVFEITEREDITNSRTFLDSIQHYREQNFIIAVDDFGAKYSGLNRVCMFSPEYLKLDMELVRNINEDKMKEIAVRAVVNFCQEAGIFTLAEGIETESEMNTLIEIGVDFGQGYFLAKPKPEFEMISELLKAKIRTNYVHEKTKLSISKFGKIGDICETKLFTTPDTSSIEIYEMMKENSDLTEMFVIDERCNICGILTRNGIIEAYSGAFGFSLGKRLSVEKIMSADFLYMDKDEPVDDVIIRAMERESKFVYDSIAVVNNNEYMGTVSIKKLLLSSIEIKNQGYITAEKSRKNMA